MRYLAFDSDFSFSIQKDEFIDEKVKNIRIYESKITFNGKEFKRDKLDNFIKLIEKFEINISKKDKNINYDEIKSSIMKVNKEIEELDSYLNVRTSNGKENDSQLEENVKKIKGNINELKEKLSLNLENIENILTSQKQIEDDRIFIEDHDKHIILYEEPKKKEIFHITEDSYLKYPMISDNGTQITFSFKQFEMFLGSYIPSIISSPLIIKLLNLKGIPIKGVIRDDNENVVTVKENNNYLDININIQNLRIEKIDKKVLKFQLEIQSKNYNNLKINFILGLNLIPLSIIFIPIFYKLNYDSEKNIFDFLCDTVYSNSKINFIFKYEYFSDNPNQLNNNTVNFKYTLVSLEKNNANQPELIKEENKLMLIPKYAIDLNNILNFILTIYFSSTFYINIKFDCKILPFDFGFKCYSYDKKKFLSEEIKIYIDKDNLPLDYILYFKIEKKTGIQTLAEYSFEKYIPKEFQITANSFESEKIKNEFIFSVNLKINEISNDIIKEKYYFKVQGNEIDKEIIFEPKIINKITNFETDLYNLPKYKYIPYHGKFTDEKTFQKDNIYITPFNCYIPFVKDLYKLNSRKEFQPLYDPSHEFSLFCYSQEKNEFITIKYTEDYKNNNKNIIEIIGIFNNSKWYPLIEMNKEKKKGYFQKF